MIVNARKTVDVECQVEVSLDDCINEMLSLTDEEGLNRFLKWSAIDGATTVLDRITPEMINAAAHPGSLVTIRQRLQKWIDATECQDSCQKN